MLRLPDIDFRLNPLRSSIFKDKRFVFMSAELKGEMEKAITLAGGTSLVWEEKMDRKMLDSDHVVLVKPKRTKSQDMSFSQGFLDLAVHLERMGRNSVLSTNIYLAIVHCSFSKCSSVRTRSNVLPTDGSNQQSDYSVRVPDSLHLQDSVRASGSLEGSLSTTTQPIQLNPRSRDKQSAGLTATNQSAAKPVIPPPTTNRTDSDIFKVPCSTLVGGATQSKTLQSKSAKIEESVTQQSETHRSLRNTQFTQQSFAMRETSTMQEEDEDMFGNHMRSTQSQKRPLSSDEEEAAPTSKKPTLPKDGDEDMFADGEDDLFTFEAKSTSAQPKSTTEPKFRAATEESEDDDDLFGFDPKPTTTQRKALPSTAQSKPKQAAIQGSVDRKRKELVDEDDLFGFASTPSPVKRPRIQSNQQSAKKTIENPAKKTIENHPKPPVEDSANYREEQG